MVTKKMSVVCLSVFFLLLAALAGISGEDFYQAVSAAEAESSAESQALAELESKAARADETDPPTEPPTTEPPTLSSIFTADTGKELSLKQMRNSLP